MRKLSINILFLLLFCAEAQSMDAYQSTLRVQAPLINPLAKSWISLTEHGVQAVSTTAGVVVSVGAQTMLTALGVTTIGLVPAVILGAATYYMILQKCYPQTSTGLSLQIERALDDFEIQMLGDRLVTWKSSEEIKRFAALNFYGSLKDLKEHMRLRMKKLAEIRVYLLAATSKAQTSLLQKQCSFLAERLEYFEQDTMNKFTLIDQVKKQELGR